MQKYRTAAIHYDNGSTVSVARIEGSPAYQDFMRRDAALPPTARPLCDYIPPTLGTLLGICTCPVGEDTASVEAVMRELRASVASSMGTNFCHANLVLWSRDHATDYQKQVIQQALTNIGLIQPTDGVLDGGSGAVHTNGVGSAYERTLLRILVLAVDYSRYGLGAQLFWQDADGVVEWVRGDHRLGAGPEEAAELLRAIAAPPFGDDPTYVGWSDPTPTEISKLVLYGDAILDYNDVFQAALGDVLGPRLVEDALAVDPVFAGTTWGARYAYERVNNWAFNRDPAFGCCWWSKWHNCWEYRPVVNGCLL
ncbi:hypothetical protein IMZ48_00615 [Candidatus Bathyarchaeota archaeon]|nr:hypothetical protein [Candidatus Bathyarchaeota archaeon]